jgi:Ca-activated chloride channel family protein
VSFEFPVALLALALVPAAIATYVLAQRARPRYAARFTNLELLGAVVKETPRWRRHVPAALALAALTALVVAAARPHLTFAVAERRASVMLVTDVSGSMEATDVSPTRLQAARVAALAFTDALPDDARLGLATFSSTANLNVPPTVDRALVARALEAMEAGGGTAMGDGVAAALRALREVARRPAGEGDGDGGDRGRERPPAAVVLLSDGESTSGRDPIEVAQQARRLRVPVYTIALGTPDGTITLPPSVRGWSGGPRVLPVPPDPETLRQVARTTGGRFFDSADAGELRSIYDDLGRQVATERERREVTAGFAGVGAVLLLAGGALSLLWFGRLP